MNFILKGCMCGKWLSLCIESSRLAAVTVSLTFSTRRKTLGVDFRSPSLLFVFAFILSNYLSLSLLIFLSFILSSHLFISLTYCPFMCSFLTCFHLKQSVSPDNLANHDTGHVFSATSIKRCSLSLNKLLRAHYFFSYVHSHMTDSLCLCCWGRTWAWYADRLQRYSLIQTC